MRRRRPVLNALLTKTVGEKVAQLEKNAFTMRWGALATLAQRVRYRTIRGVDYIAKSALLGRRGVVSSPC